MAVLLLLPVLISALTISAHFYRAGLTVLAFLCLLLTLLLLYRKSVTVRIMQIFLIIAAAEWGRTLLAFIQIYQENGMSWNRLAVILGSVMVFTAGSAFIFRAKTLRQRYK